ncbi:hypothetical protein IPA_03345 [Ignicoccus pacificus DSM 13166]|uniref:Uncharacterized protein n=1 Tax=Ignicoccus pacificus DSM 13166 TaxID=940294 RepID=A0A977KBX8_9CREN|nr:hypothetical protein IPA_03345 [Ignicoccus pacificus DSM 13166]
MRKGQIELYVAIGLGLLLLLGLAYYFMYVRPSAGGVPYATPLQKELGGCVNQTVDLKVKLVNPTSKTVKFEIDTLDNMLVTEKASSKVIEVPPGSSKVMDVYVTFKKPGHYFVVLIITWQSGAKSNVIYLNVPAYVTQCG